MIRRAKLKPKRYDDEMRVSQAKCTNVACGHEFMTGSGKITIRCPKCKRPAKRILQKALT